MLLFNVPRITLAAILPHQDACKTGSEEKKGGGDRVSFLLFLYAAVNGLDEALVWPANSARLAVSPVQPTFDGVFPAMSKFCCRLEKLPWIYRMV